MHFISCFYESYVYNGWNIKGEIKEINNIELPILETKPQEEILEQIRPVCEHNYTHMMRTDWYGKYFMPAFVAYFVQT